MTVFNTTDMPNREAYDAVDITTMNIFKMTNGNWSLSTNEVPNVLPIKVYDSIEEMIMIYIYAMVMMVLICGLHILVITTIVRNPSLHTPYNYIITAFSIMDININFMPNIYMVIATALVDPIPTLTCRMFAFFGIVAFFSLVQLVAIMAYERYRFFYHPFTHSTYFTTTRTLVSIGISFVIVLTYTIMTEILIGRVHHASILYCHLKGTIYMNYVQLFTFLLPSLIVSAYCMFKIWRMTITHRVAPAADPANQQEQDDAVVPKMRLALRSLLLVSGAFWGSYVPAFITRTVIFSVGYTWYDLDTRRVVWAAVLVRVTNFMITNMSSLLNPVIYYYTNKDLRIAMHKMVGLKPRPQDVSEA